MHFVGFENGVSSNPRNLSMLKLRILNSSSGQISSVRLSPQVALRFRRTLRFLVFGHPSCQCLTRPTTTHQPADLLPIARRGVPTPDIEDATKGGMRFQTWHVNTTSRSCETDISSPNILNWYNYRQHDCVEALSANVE